MPAEPDRGDPRTTVSPGEQVPHHDTFETKLAHARLLRDDVGIRRAILVDGLAGTAHRRHAACRA
jgi:hypothetical protein